jgi:hypothetical protein
MPDSCILEYLSKLETKVENISRTIGGQGEIDQVKNSAKKCMRLSFLRGGKETNSRKIEGKLEDIQGKRRRKKIQHLGGQTLKSRNNKDSSGSRRRRRGLDVERKRQRLYERKMERKVSRKEKLRN